MGTIELGTVHSTHADLLCGYVQYTLGHMTAVDNLSNAHNTKCQLTNCICYASDHSLMGVPLGKYH